MTNEYGVKLDSNGYAPSIIHDTTCCWCCYRSDGDLVRHEVFNGAGLREKSKRLGLCATLCPTCHAAIHANARRRLALKASGQLAAMHTMDGAKTGSEKNFTKAISRRTT